MSEIQKSYSIVGGTPLQGRVCIRGAKNAVTKEMVAALCTSGVTNLSNVPDIGDVEVTAKILTSLGCQVSHDKSKGQLVIDTQTLRSSQVPVEYSGVNRIPILLAGVLLSRFKSATIPILGGCQIGKRPVDFHIEGLKSLGAMVEFQDNTYTFKCDQLRGAHIALPYPSVGATENLIMAAVLAKGTTVIRNAAVEPEIVDLSIMLQAMGAIITLETDRTWVIEGVENLFAASHRVINDRIEAASFAVSALATSGDVIVEGADPLHLQAFLNWLRRAGAAFEIREDGIRFKGSKSKLKSVALETDVHPGVMTDWQQPLAILLTQAEGASVIHETVYENRFGYTEALKRMGARVQLFQACLGGCACRFRHAGHFHSAVIIGPTKLKGTELEIPDLRGGFSYLVAALIADGTSILKNVHLIERGYENILEKFTQLGARISVLKS